MTDKKNMFETGVVKLDFLAKEDTDFEKGIAALDKKIESDGNVDLNNVISSKVKSESSK